MTCPETLFSPSSIAYRCKGIAVPFRQSAREGAYLLPSSRRPAGCPNPLPDLCPGQIRQSLRLLSSELAAPPPVPPARPGPCRGHLLPRLPGLPDSRSCRGYPLLWAASRHRPKPRPLVAGFLAERQKGGRSGFSPGEITRGCFSAGCRSLFPKPPSRSLSSRHSRQRLLVGLRIVLDRNLGRHATHRECPAPMAGANQQLRIAAQERNRHGDLGGALSRKYFVRMPLEAFDIA